MASTITVSYSELDAFRQCPLKWYLNYQKLWSQDKGEGTALNRGSAWHTIMQTHYEAIKEMRRSDTRFGPDGRGVFLENPSRARQQEILERASTFVFRQHLVDKNGEQSEQQELLGWMYQGHLEQYGLDLQWRVHGIETAGAVWLLNENGNRTRFRLKYKMDLLVWDLDTKQWKIVDHKSAADFSRQVEIDIDDQFGLYTWAHHRETGQRVSCVIRSDARTKRNKGPMTLDQRFQRQQTMRGDKELDNIALDAYRTAKAAYMPGRPVHSSPAPDRCKWRCDYLEAHLAARKGFAPMDTILVDFGFTQREVKHQEYTKEEGQN